MSIKAYLGMGKTVMPELNKKTFHELLTTLSLIIDYQGGKQLYHAWRVAIVAKYLSDEINIRDSQWLFYAGLLHDVGITGMGNHPAEHPDLKDSELSDSLRNHPLTGAKIVAEIPGMDKIVTWIRDHHEWINGKGFPEHKKGTDIHLSSQILRMADDYDLRFRVKPDLTRTDLYEYYRQHAGKEFKTELWDVFRRFNNKDMGIFFYEINDDAKIPFKLKELLEELPYTKHFNGDDEFIESILKVFGIVIDAKHPYTAGHSKRVRDYSIILSKRLGLNKREIKKIAMAAYLHDLGKIAIPLSILDKPGPLSKSEWKIMKKHTVYTMELIDSVDILWDLGPLAGYSQENYDGKGYPDGLKGKEIPIGSRIIAVADAMDAIKTKRSYKKALSWKTVIGELKKSSGNRYDPEIVYEAVAYIKEEQLY